MRVTDQHEPIERIAIDGPAVRAHRERREDNNHERMTTDRLNASYDRVKESNLDALKTLGQRS